MLLTTEELLAQSQRQFKAAIKAINGIVWTANASGEMIGDQEAWAELTGQTFDEYTRLGWSKAVHADDVQSTLDAWRNANTDGKPFNVEHRVRRRDGEWRLYSVRAIPASLAVAENLEWVGIHIDITEERATQHRLARTAAHLSLALDAGQTGTWELDLLTGNNTWDDRLFGLWGITGPVAPSLETFLSMINPKDREQVRVQIDALRQPGEADVFEAEFRITRVSDGEERWLAARGKLLESNLQGRTLLGTMRDVTDRVRRDERIRFLMGELTHRTKNILAVVQAIARQTAQDAPSIELFNAAFARRITAIAGSLDLLIKENWNSASMLELVRIQTSPIVGDNGDRIRLTGDDVALLPDAAQNLGLALHELSTNAVKYGALSVPGGHVALGWRIVDGAGDEPVFSLTWKEFDGPPVAKPVRKGFGHIVMNRLVKAALSGNASLEFEPDGVKWSVTVPASQILHMAGPTPKAGFGAA
jgi:PAS domain S-box-containing protein